MPIVDGSAIGSGTVTVDPSCIVTTNLPFGEWTKVFADALPAKAVVDPAHPPRPIIETRSESGRFKHGLAQSKRRRGTPT